MTPQLAAHLVRRCVRWAIDSLPAARPSAPPVALSPRETALWSAMRRQDRSHALRVLARFDRLAPGARDEVRRGVLLHDVGKVASGVGLVGRIAATALGPLRPRWREYLDHERIGAEMLQRGGSSEATWQMVAGRGDPALVEAFRKADDE